MRLLLHHCTVCRDYRLTNVSRQQSPPISLTHPPPPFLPLYTSSHPHPSPSTHPHTPTPPPPHMCNCTALNVKEVAQVQCMAQVSYVSPQACCVGYSEWQVADVCEWTAEHSRTMHGMLQITTMVTLREAQQQRNCTVGSCLLSLVQPPLAGSASCTPWQAQEGSAATTSCFWPGHQHRSRGPILFLLRPLCWHTTLPPSPSPWQPSSRRSHHGRFIFQLM